MAQATAVKKPDIKKIKKIIEKSPQDKKQLIMILQDIQRDLHLDVIDDGELGEEIDEIQEPAAASDLERMIGDDDDVTEVVKEKPGKSISASTA